MAGATPPGQDERNPSTGVQRPSLFSATADETVRIEPDTSIMAALDGRLRKPPPSRTAPVWGAVGAVAVVMGLAAWWWQDNAAAPAAPVAARAASVPAAKVAVKPPEVASAVASAPASAVLASAESTASTVMPRAVIEETAAGESKVALVAAQAPATAASTPVGGAAVAAVATAAAAAAVSVTRSPEPKVVKPAREVGKASTKAASAKPAEPVAAATKTTKVDTKQTPEMAPAPAPVAKDADVELLAAMMRYTDEVAAPGASKPRAQSSASRMNELTIADLVKRCKALGGDEATQCKKRICSGYWGKAEACPAKQAPVASKPKKQPA